MERKKIAFLDEGRDIGGAERNLAGILEHLNKDEFDVLVILACKDRYCSILNSLDVATSVIPTPPFLSTSIECGRLRIFNPCAALYDLFLVLFKSLKLNIFLGSHRDISLLQTNAMFEHLYGGLAAKMTGISCIWHFQDIPSNTFFGLGIACINLFGIIFPKTIVAISNEVKMTFCSRVQKKVVVIHNGTDVQRFTPKRKEDGKSIKNNLGIDESESIVGMVTRIVPWKGHKVFLEAARIVSDRFSAVRFLIVGDTSFGKSRYAWELKELAKKLSIQEKVIFTGFVENVEDMMAVTDIFVHCSIRPEPFGLAIIEAMALGKAVVATNLGAPKEIITPGQDGVLIKPGNPEALADAIIEMLKSPEKYNEMGIAARRTIEKNFDIHTCTKNLEDIYRSYHDARTVSNKK